jgi:hypothetical protein
MSLQAAVFTAKALTDVEKRLDLNTTPVGGIL